MKPCPFCGGKAFATYKTRDHDGLCQHWVICEGCDARTGSHNFSEADATSAWQRRASAPSFEAWWATQKYPKHLKATLSNLWYEAQASLAAADDTYTDENGTVWERPSAWAYAQVCKARDKWHSKARERK